MTKRKCERCNCWGHEDELTYREDDDEYWCPSCIDNETEAAYDRHQEYLMETGGGPSLRDQQIEARKLK